MFSEDQIRRKDIDTLKRWLRYKLSGYQVAIINIEPHFMLYRAVRCPERPDLVSRISYPRREHVTKLGRANRIEQPMFYCSCGGPAVFYELQAQPGDLVAMSEWEVMETLWMHNLGFHPDALRRIGTPSNIYRPRQTHPIPNESKQNARLRRQLSLAFTEDVPDGQETKYKQSVAINELHFDKASPLPRYVDGPRFDQVSGTVYPAMKMRGAADNVVMQTKFVDSSLRLNCVRYVRVEAVDVEKRAYTLLIEGIANTFEGGNIDWQKDLPEESLRRNFVELKDGVWVFRNERNGIYNIHFG